MTEEKKRVAASDVWGDKWEQIKELAPSQEVLRKWTEDKHADQKKAVAKAPKDAPTIKTHTLDARPAVGESYEIAPHKTEDIQAYHDKEAEVKKANVFANIDEDGNILPDKYTVDNIDTEKKKSKKKQYERKVKTLKADLAGDGVGDRMKRGLLATADKYILLGASGLNKLGADIDTSTYKAAVQAGEELTDEYTKAHQTPQRQAEVAALSQGVSEAKGVLDTTKATARLLLDKVSHPSESDIAGGTSELISDPLNIVAPEASVIAKSAKLGKTAKTLVGAGAGATAQGVLAGGSEYALAKATDKSDAQAQQAGIMAGVLGAGMGAIGGGIAGRTASKVKAKTPEQINDKINADVSKGTDGDRADIPSDGLDTSKVKDFADEMTEDTTSIVNEIMDNEIVVVKKAEEAFSEKKQILDANTGTTPEEKNAYILQNAPLTPEEKAVGDILNDGAEVSPRFDGLHARDALEKSITTPTKSKEELIGTLVSEGVPVEKAKVMGEAYEKRDITLYDEWASDKIANEINGAVDEHIRTRADTQKEDTTSSKTDDVDAVSAAREGATKNEQQKPIQTDRNGDKEPLSEPRQDTSKDSTVDAVPAESKKLARHETPRDDAENIPKSRREPVVQDEKVLDTETKLGEKEASVYHDIATIKENPSYEALPMNGKLKQLKKHPHYESHVAERKTVKSTDAKYDTKKVQDGTLTREGDYFPPSYEKNYAADFTLTKADIAKIEAGKADASIIAKLEEDLGRIDNDPVYNVERDVANYHDKNEDIATVVKDMPEVDTSLLSKVDEAEYAHLKRNIDTLNPDEVKRFTELDRAKNPKEYAFVDKVWGDYEKAKKSTYNHMRSGKAINPFHKDVQTIARTEILKGANTIKSFAKAMQKVLPKAWKRLKPKIKQLFHKAYNQVEKWAETNGHRGQIVRSIIGRSYAMGDDIPSVKAPKIEKVDEIAPGTLPTETKSERIRRSLQDKFIRVKQLQEVKAGKRIDDSINMYQAEELYHKRASNKMELFEKKIQEPLLKAIGDSKYEIEDVDAFLHARHAKERNKNILEHYGKENGSGMSDVRADELLAEYDTPEMKKIAEYIDAMNDAKLTIMEREGLESKEAIDMLRNNYEHYVPLRRKMDEDGFSSSASRGSGFDVKGKESKHAKGSDREVESPIIHSIMSFQDTLVRAEKNRVGKTFLNFIEEFPDESLYEVESVKHMPRYDKNGEVISIDPQYKLQDNVMHVKIDGKVKQITIHDPALASGWKNLSPTKLNRLQKGAAKIVQFYAAINTQWNPEFVISNFMRDIQAATLNLPIEVKVNRVKFAKDVGGAIKGIYKKDGEWGKLFDELNKEGGTTGWMDQYNVVDLEKQLKKQIAIDTGNAPVAKTIKAVGDYIDHANMSVENGVRLVAYKHAKESGLTNAQAASIAKNLTVNFNRKGEAGSLINSMYMFYNASAQGSVRLLQALKTSNKARIGAGGLVGTAVALDMYNRSVNEDKYKLIPRFVKDTNLVIMREDGTYFKVPLPYGWNVFKSMGDAVSEGYHDGKVADAAGRLLSATVNAFSPIGVDSEDLVHTAIPTVGKLLYETQNNINFMGKKIMPDSPYATKVDSHSYFKSVNPQLKDTAIWLNKVTGGSTYVSGHIDISPETMEHILGWVTGGLGKTLLNSATFITHKLKGEETSWRKVPFARKLISELNEKSEYYGAMNIKQTSFEEKKVVEPKDREVFYKLMDLALENEEVDADKYKKQIRGFANHQIKLEWSKKFDVQGDSNIEDLEPKLKIEYYRMQLEIRKDPKFLYRKRDISRVRNELKKARREL